MHGDEWEGGENHPWKQYIGRETLQDTCVRLVHDFETVEMDPTMDAVLSDASLQSVQLFASFDPSMSVAVQTMPGLGAIEEDSVPEVSFACVATNVARRSVRI